MTAVRRLSQLIRERQERLNERREHDFAMQDAGVANEHALSISRAVGPRRARLHLLQLGGTATTQPRESAVTPSPSISASPPSAQRAS